MPVRSWSPLVVSKNGHHWSKDLDVPIFGKRVRVVPGETRTGFFYVRNRSDDRAVLRVKVRVREADLAMARAFGLAVRHHGRWHAVDRSGSARVGIGPKQVRRIEVRTRFKPTSDNATRKRAVRFGFRLTLTQRSTR